MCVYVHNFIKELELTTSGDGFGFSLGGGMDGPSVNPVDPTDYGIFITKVCGIVIVLS